MKELVSITICAILPICIVLITSINDVKKANNRTKVLIKAIEANNSIDADKLASALNKPRKTPAELLGQRLLRGCVLLLLGLFFIGYYVIDIAGGTSHHPDFLTTIILLGGSSSAIGAGFLIAYFVTRKQIKADNGQQQ